MPDKNDSRQGMGRGLRTLLITLGLLLVTLAATTIEIAVRPHNQRPLVGNVVALAILNINILLLVLLLVLLGRQFVKFYFERKASPFGAGFRTKLLTALIALSIIPSALLFVIAGGLLTGGVGYFFGPRVESTMKDSIALVQSYKEDRRGLAQHYADTMAGQMKGAAQDRASLKRFADSARTEYGLDMVEVYWMDGRNVALSGWNKFPWAVAQARFIKEAAATGKASSVTSTKQGDVVRGAAVFRDRNGRSAGVVMADYVLSPVISNNIADITKFYEEYWDLRTFKNPLKESYLLSFMLITLIIVFAAAWFGLYVSKGITVPITTLAEATHRISRGEYDFPIEVRASDEIGVLVDSFKRMTRDLKSSREKLDETNQSLMRTNELLELRRQFIETVLENVNAGVITIDRAGKVGMVNRAAQTITGLEAEGIAGRNYREVFEFHQLDEIREQVGMMAESREASIERDIQITVNRRSLTLRLFVSALHDTVGGYLGILIVFDDLTELIKAQRASAWKEVARRIAHEVKNPLTPIQLSAQRLRKKYLEGSGDYENIINECTETIITQVESMKTLVDEFSKFARMPEARPVPSDLHAIIDEVATLYTGAHRDVEIVRAYDPSLPSVDVDKEQMKRVFMNLFENALTAMDGKGRITVATNHDAQSRTATITVSDEGSGILPEDREKLFQPYFSKNKSGTGLGLAIVSRIISDHGGYIRAEGNIPKGAKFIIELPVRG